jgi:hypothetical protein
MLEYCWGGSHLKTNGNPFMAVESILHETYDGCNSLNDRCPMQGCENRKSRMTNILCFKGMPLVVD